DCLAILKAGGVNWIRLRVWNDPVNAADVVENGKVLSKAGDPVGGGNDTVAAYIRIAKRARKLGLKVMLDFHYSDFWADPGKQTMPKAWVGLDLDALKKALYRFTDSSLKAMRAAGAMPDMVQIGNEVDNGFLWPVGKLYPSGDERVGGMDAFIALLKEASRAVRANDPNAKAKPGSAAYARRIKIAIHLSSGGDQALYRKTFDPIVAAGVDFDVIGLSFYPYWHGKIDDLSGNMAMLAIRYHKEMLVAEIAYAWTTEDADGFPNAFGPGLDRQGGYKATPQGQASAIGDLVAAAAGAPDDKGIGVFYWEPDWIPFPGVGWRTGEGNNWENQALFDFTGRALPSLNVFKLARSEGETPSLSIVSVEDVQLKIPAGGVLALPEAIRATYTDDSYRLTQVKWDKPDPSALAQVGQIVVPGTVFGYKGTVKATVDIVANANLIPDASFESGALDQGWVLAGDGIKAAAPVEKNPGNAHSGDYSFKYWLDKPFQFTLTRRFTGLKDGKYTFRAWAMGGGGEKNYYLFARGYGGPDLTATMVNTGWQKWKLYEVKGIPVSGGTCE
ncbi:MAG TPA: glycosyl hydrolase 53 family protein, partial [Spirochaetia bacterium]|nr:glycosyl hydrolase 53 family protein [Spirochaetia bacterium]